MKIAFLIDRYVTPRAGTERQLKLLAEGLRERGHEVVLGVLRDTDFVSSGGFPGRVDVLNAPKVFSAGAWWRVHRWGRRLRSEGVRIIQIYFNDAAVLGPTALRLAGLKVVVCRRDMGFWYSPLVLALLRMSAWAVDVVLANSRAAGEAACAAEGFPPRKLLVIHNGVPALMGNGDETNLEWSGVPLARGPRIGIVANIRPIKRIDNLIRAFQRVVESIPEAELVVVGGGDTAELAALAEVLGCEARVRFAGSVGDPSAWISTFDVGVSCSESEGLSNALLEYMRHAKPVVATRTGGNPEVVFEGRNGLLVPVGDTVALAEALLCLLRDPNEARRMGEAGARLVSSEFSVDRMIERQLDVYERLVGGPVAASPVAGPNARSGEAQ